MQSWAAPVSSGSSWKILCGEFSHPDADVPAIRKRLGRSSTAAGVAGAATASRTDDRWRY
jgi:hypothetical protein